MISQWNLMFSKNIACELHFQPNAQSVIYLLFHFPQDQYFSESKAGCMVVLTDIQRYVFGGGRGQMGGGGP